MFRRLTLGFHLLGIVLSIILLCVDDPGYDPVWIWLVGSIVLNVVFLIVNMFSKEED